MCTFIGRFFDTHNNFQIKITIMMRTLSSFETNYINSRSIQIFFPNFLKKLKVRFRNKLITSRIMDSSEFARKDVSFIVFFNFLKQLIYMTIYLPKIRATTASWEDFDN